MIRNFLVVGLAVCTCVSIDAQTTHAPYAPFTAGQAQLGKELVAKSLEIRKQITDGSARAEPFRMVGNLYFVGVAMAGAEEFSQVIQQGESLLAGSRTLPRSTLSSLHFMVGDAYATIVWLAMTDSKFHDPKKYQQMAGSARVKALEHYRAAFNLEHGTARAQKTWKEAWRLAAGLPPISGRYFCVYE